MYEKIKTLKELLDAGAITQEEFDGKKADLLRGDCAEKEQGGERVEKVKASMSSAREKAKSSMAGKLSLTAKSASISVIVLGLVLLLVGVFLPVPGTHLTTYESLDGEFSSSGEKYSAIEEYVGGDAYNYITGAALVGGEIAGAKAQKAVFASSGLAIASIGLLSYARFRKEEPEQSEAKNL